ncbi:small VCP interacting protein [Lasioglossum baleicum]|uniref:small VCP interacting protein n=1 Tax=Lasioglossum baleicum TaxID=434251 RepID=UPI003FCC56DF
MGNLCASCCKQSASCENLTPDLETRRRQQKEAAERRIAEQQTRGIKNMDAVRRQQRLDEQREKREEEASAYKSQPPLKWQVN